MNQLLELSKIISRHKAHQIDVVGANEITLSNQLFQALAQGRVSSDEEAARLLYDSSPNDYRYRKLKTRLRTKLLNMLFLLDLSKTFDLPIEKAYYRCLKTYTLASILFTKMLRPIAIELLESKITDIIKYEFTDLGLLYCKYLRRHYAQIDKNEKKYQTYRSLATKFSEEQSAESKAEEYYADIMHYDLDSKSADRKEILEIAKQYTAELTKIRSKYDTFKFLRFMYMTFVHQYMLEGNYEKVIEISNEGINRIAQKPFLTRNLRFSMHLYAMTCYIQTGKYQETQKIAEHYLQYFKCPERNWYVTKYYYFISLVYDRKYAEAFGVLTSVTTPPEFKKLYTGFRQNWLVNEAYMHWLLRIGEIEEADLEGVKSKKFRLYKFLNDVPVFSKDKRGLNISILIVHVLLLLHQHKYSQIIDRVDALKQYCYRYLRKDETFRSNCFIRMLLLLPKHNFNRLATERHTAKLWNKLLSVPNNIVDQGIEIEIIPYEDLWPMVLKLLKTK